MPSREDEQKVPRRLPKRPGTPPSSPLSEGVRVESSPGSIARGRSFFFEVLPDPEIPNLESPAQVRLDSSIGSFSSDKQVELPTSSPAIEASVPDLEVPNFYLHANRAAEVPSPPVPSPPRWSFSPREPVQESAENNASVSDRVSQDSGSMFPHRGREQDVRAVSGATPSARHVMSGDPKPAAHRPSRPVRSRPRPSGSFAVARASGEIPAYKDLPVAASLPPDGLVRTSDTPPAVTARKLEQTRPRSDSAAVPVTGATADDAEDLIASHRAGLPDRQGRNVSSQRVKRKRVKTVTGMVIASALLVAYAFKIGELESAADAFARRMNADSTANGLIVEIAGALPWLLVVPAVLLFGCILWFFAGLVGLRRTNDRKKKQKRETRQERLPMLEFKTSAEELGIRGRTAFRTWRLLEEMCEQGCEISTHASLSGDLRLSSSNIRLLHLRLLADLSRPSHQGMRLPAVETVLQLMQAVDAIPEQRVAGTSGEVTIPGDPGKQRRRSKPGN